MCSKIKSVDISSEAVVTVTLSGWAFYRREKVIIDALFTLVATHPTRADRMTCGEVLPASGSRQVPLFPCPAGVADKEYTQ